MRYRFGKNWEKFVLRYFNAERTAIAGNNILEFLGLKDLSGKYFLDIGCGSGMASLAAHTAGAELVIAFDLDPDSVATTRKIREMHGCPDNWIILEGSILDQDFISTIKPADIVYAWGVLHHTGDQWKALENAASLMKPDGLLYVAMYTSGHWSDPFDEYWMDLKYRYNKASFLGRKNMEFWYLWRFFVLPGLRRGKNPLSYVREYKEKNRGMDFWTDQKDWLGGWPMQYSEIREVQEFCGKLLGLEQINIKTGQANTQYLFQGRTRQP